MSNNQMLTEIVNKVKRMKKEDYIVLALVGILLVIIALPTKSADENTVSEKTISASENETEENFFVLENNDENMAKSDNNIRYSKKEDYDYGIAYAEELEKKVEEILKNVAGAGKVSVMITLANLGEEIVEKDTEVTQKSTDEKDSEGGNRQQQEKEQTYQTIYTVDDSGNEVPYVVQTKLPAVTGVVVLAEGAENQQVKENIIEALEVLFGINEHKIRVIKMKS